MRIAPPRLKSARADGTGPKPKLQRDHRTYLRRHRRDVSRVCTPSGVPSLTPCATLWLGAMHRAAADARVGPLNGSFVACARNCKHAALKRGRVGVARAERWCCIPSRACRRPRCTARLPASHNTHARTHMCGTARSDPVTRLSGDVAWARQHHVRPAATCSMQLATCKTQARQYAACTIRAPTTLWLHTRRLPAATAAMRAAAAHTQCGGVVPACLGERGRDALDALGTGLHRTPPHFCRARFCAVRAVRPSHCLPHCRFCARHGCRSIGFALRRWMDAVACAIIAIASASARARFTRDTRSPAVAAPNIHPRRPRAHASRGYGRRRRDGLRSERPCKAGLEASSAGSGGPSTLAPYQYCEYEDATASTL